MTTQTGLPQLQDYRNFLRFPVDYTSDDSMLLDWIIPGVEDAVRAQVGDFIPQSYEEFYDGGDFSIWLRHKPVLEVQMVEEGWGFTDYVLDQVQVNASTTADMFAFSLDLPASGKISRRSGGNVNIPFIPGEANIHVIYTCGRDAVPGAIGMCLMELAAIWYQNFLQRQMTTGSQYSMQTVEAQDAFARSAAISSRNMGIPGALLAMLQPFRRDPIIG